MANAPPPTLYRRWPTLAARRLPLVAGPTPLEAVTLDGVTVHVKDEGRAGRVFGGAEVRKLELSLGEARARAAVDVLTLGRLGSERIVATLAWTRHLGMRPLAVVLRDRDTPANRQRARLVDTLAEGWFECPRDAAVVWGLARAWGSTVALGQRRLFRLPEHRLAVEGIIGWVAGGLELAEQLHAQSVVFDRVVVPFTRGHTAAGLYLGLRLGGMGIEVLAVRGRGSRLGSLASLLRQVRLGEHHLQRAGVPVEVDGSGLRVVIGAEAPTTYAAALGLTETPGLSEALTAARAGERVVWLQAHSTTSVDHWLAESLAEPPARLQALLE